MSKRLRRWGNSIVSKIMLIAVLLVLFPALLWGYSWTQNAREQVIEHKIHASNTLAVQVMRGLEQKIDILGNFLQIVANDSKLIQLITFGAPDREIVQYIMNEYKPMVSLLTYQLDEVRAVRILHGNEQLFNVTNLLYYCKDFGFELKKRGITSRQIAVEYMQDEGRLYAFTGLSEPDHDVWYITRGVSATPIGEPCALIEIALDNKMFTDTIHNISLDQSTGMALISWNGGISAIGGNINPQTLDSLPLQAEGQYAVNVNGDSYIALIHPNTELKASVVVVIARKELALASDSAWNIVLTIAFVVLSMLGFALTGSQLLLRRLKMLTDAVDTFVPGQRSMVLPHQGSDEIARLIRHFNRMGERLYQASMMERKLLYNELISQIKPHFVLNALDMLRLRALDEKADGLAKSALQISQYFRHTMLSDTDSIALSDELQSVQNYISLVNSMRTYPVQCRISLDAWAESEAMAMHVPAMILQPLAENAIKHGIGADMNGIIHISVTREDDVMCICVEDNGRAMNAEQLERLNHYLQTPNESQTEHIGIQNVARRLSLSYPDSSTLTLESIPNVGVCASITIRVDVLRPALKVENSMIKDSSTREVSPK